MSDYNRNFGRIALNGEIVYAPQMIWPNPNPPTAAEYAAAGWLPVINEPPTEPAPQGKHWEPQGWEEREGCVRRVFAAVDDPAPAPRTFSKLKCVAALMATGVWPQVKQYIEEAGLYDLYLAAQDFREDNEYFVRGRAALQTALGWTDEQVGAILDAAEVGE